ncbi:sulfocyanin-like copper-binding protein [Alicyclobacillus macrosporangiidus]|uniref:sulfocyanin-like copper-binding protein n=1 Tax=Alicyclobacillus macrosporangiidus TaxID=392015 RepID=UPI00068F3A79|nr:sulfocyanin-like copper-binding protein [Alicyclobacillus macrosporangiidus]
MKLSPLGVLVVALGGLVAIIIWIVGYIGLPNQVTHRDLAHNPQVETSLNATSGGAAGGAAGGQAGQKAAWYALGKEPKSIDLTITAQSGDNPMNFNGYGKGALKITVPVGWKVNVTFVNQQGQVPHSVGFVQWADRESPTGQFTPAFDGSVGDESQFKSGVTSAGQKYSFTADKAGQYAMVCGVPGHAAAGMWDEFDVDAHATAPTITTPEGTVTVK